MSSDRSFIFLTALVSIGGLALAIHSFMWGDILNGGVAAIHFFRVYMDQIIFDSSYLLRPANFLEDLSYAFGFLRAVYLFNHHSKCSHLSPWISVSVFVFYSDHPFFEVYCIAFILLHYLLSLILICCHSLSFLFTRCHSLSLVVIRCQSLSLDVLCLFYKWS